MPQITPIQWLTWLLLAMGLSWLWARVARHPWLQQQRSLRGAEIYFESQVDKLPATPELVQRQLLWMVAGVGMLLLGGNQIGEAGSRSLLLLGGIVLAGALLRLLFDLLGRPQRSLRTSSKGLSYLDEAHDFVPYEEIVVILDFEQALIIKTPEDIFEFTFENEPEDYAGFLESLELVRQTHHLPLPYIKC